MRAQSRLGSGTTILESSCGCDLGVYLLLVLGIRGFELRTVHRRRNEDRGRLKRSGSISSRGKRGKTHRLGPRRHSLVEWKDVGVVRGRGQLGSGKVVLPSDEGLTRNDLSVSVELRDACTGTHGQCSGAEGEASGVDGCDGAGRLLEGVRCAGAGLHQRERRGSTCLAHDRGLAVVLAECIPLEGGRAGESDADRCAEGTSDDEACEGGGDEARGRRGGKVE